jgi:hypothetical protein
MQEKNKPVIAIAVAIGVSLVVAFGGYLLSHLSSEQPDLNAQVSNNASGISITNMESVSWRGCEVGVNAGCGVNFWHPPYQTHQSMTFAPGQTITVPYSTMTDQNGDQFSGQPTSIVVMCSNGTSDPVERSYCGTKPGESQ